MAYHYLCPVSFVHTPETAEELADQLQRAARHDRTITLNGAGSKCRMAGPIAPSDETFTTVRMSKLLQYEPNDLTVSVQAGMPWRDFCAILAENRQIVPLDPPFARSATVGGVIACNQSGPRRLHYGSARDVVIGMQYATLEGKLVQSGGMVVKNVAGLDTAKLMIGSFGTLAAITVVNFKLAPMPEHDCAFLLPFATAELAIAARDRILTSGLQPSVLDLLNPGAASSLGNESWLLAARAAGTRAAMERFERELAVFEGALAFESTPEQKLWEHIEEFTPRFLARAIDGAVVRASCTLKSVGAVMESFPGPAIARAGTGVCYGYFDQADQAASWLKEAVARGWKAVIEFAPEVWKRNADLWPAPGGDLELMRRVKQLYDPGNVLNRGRLYGRI